MMRKFGYWREETSYLAGPETIRDWLLPGGPLPDAERVAEYLERATNVVATGGIDFVDLLTGERVRGDEGVRTDGEWVWPETLPHYVRRGLGLPSELLGRIRDRGYVPSVATLEQVEALAEEVERMVLATPRPFSPDERVKFLAALEGLRERLHEEDEEGARGAALAGDVLGAWTLLWAGLSLSGTPLDGEERSGIRRMAESMGVDVDSLAAQFPLPAG